MGKTFYWLKLKNDFFGQREIKKLRRIAGGDTFTIIYLKMQLLSIKNGGIITFEGTESSLEEQLSIELDEEPENVKLTLAFLRINSLIEPVSESEYLLNKVPEMVGSETDAAERMRKMRNNVTTQLQAVTNGYTEIEIEIEKSKSTESETDNRVQSKEKENVNDMSMTSQEIPLYLDSQSNSLNSKVLSSKVPSTKVKKESISLDTVISAFTDNPAVIEAIQAYIEMRVKIRKEPTARALQQVLKKLESFDDGQKIIFLDTSTLHNWVDVYTDKTEQPKPFYQNKPTPNILKPIPDYSLGESTAERWAREDREKAEREKEAAK